MQIVLLVVQIILLTSLVLEVVTVPMRLRLLSLFNRYGQLSGMVEPIAGLLGAVAVVIAEPLLPYALAFAAGAMIYVVVDDIIPEAQMWSVLAMSCCCVVFEMIVGAKLRFIIDHDYVISGVRNISWVHAERTHLSESIALVSIFIYIFKVAMVSKNNLRDISMIFRHWFCSSVPLPVLHLFNA